MYVFIPIFCTMYVYAGKVLYNINVCMAVEMNTL